VVGLSVEPGNESIEVSWQPPADGDDSVSGYQVEVRKWGTSSVEQSHEVAVTGLGLGNLTNGQQYVVSVVAFNDDGVGTAVDSPVVKPFGVAEAPRRLRARNREDGLLLYWRAPVDDGGASIDEYIVRVSWGRAKNRKNDLIRVDGRSVLLTGLTPGKRYSLWVSASNAAGSSAFSNKLIRRAAR